MTVEQQIGVRCGNRFSTYPDLFGRALRAARGLHELGIGLDHRVALLLRNCIEFLEVSIATVPLGASPVPINWHARSEEVAHVLTDSAAKVLIVHGDLLPAIASGVPNGVTVVLVSADGEGSPTDLPAGVVAWDDLLAGNKPWAQAPEGTPISIIYTSGTTGRAKGVVRAPLTDAQYDAARKLLGDLFELGPGERTVIPAPLYHTAPNGYALAAAVRRLDMTIMTGFEAEEFLRIVQERRITVVQMVPTMFVRLLSLPKQTRESYDLSSLRFVVHAAAPCPVQVKRAMIKWLGPIICEYYGSTEMGPVTFCTGEEWLAHPGTVGRPIEGARVKILDLDGNELPAGVSGEVYSWLDVWPDFTYEGDEEKRRAIERDGLISCGDVGYLDDDGYLYLNDRLSDVVISGGVNIYPAEIEACLLSLWGVRDCAVFGIPDDEFGEAMAAYIQLAKGAQLNADAVRDHVYSRLASYKVPRVVEFTDSLPREDSGKIFKRRLREPYWRGRGSSI